MFCFRRQPLAELIGLLQVLRELRFAHAGFALLGEHSGIVAAVVVELVGVETVEHLRGAEHAQLAGGGVHQVVVVVGAVHFLVRAVHGEDGGRALGLVDYGVAEVGVVDCREYEPLHEGAEPRRGVASVDMRDAHQHVGLDGAFHNGFQVVGERAYTFLAALHLAGEAAHAAFVVHIAVVEIDHLHLGASLASALHGALQQLRRVEVLTGTPVDE